MKVAFRSRQKLNKAQREAQERCHAKMRREVDAMRGDAVAFAKREAQSPDQDGHRFHWLRED